jgi:prepilin peptidase CpaA
MAVSIALSAWGGVVAWRDAATRRIPDALVAALLLPAIVVLAVTGRGLAGAAWGDSLGGGALASAVLLPGWLKGWMGAGDVKFAAAAGFVLGWLRTCEMLLAAAIVLGGASALVLAKAGWKSGRRVPAGPAIAAGFVLELLGGPWIFQG